MSYTYSIHIYRKTDYFIIVEVNQSVSYLNILEGEKFQGLIDHSN